MNKIFFSIITPTYNRAQKIYKPIESVLKQNFESWEMIIVDDGSTDDTEEIVKSYIEKDKRIKYFKLEKNTGGPNIPRNRASEKAEGEWLIFLDSDDELVENALSVVREYIKKFPEVDFFIFNCKDLDGNIPLNIRYYQGYISFKDFLCKIKGEALPIVKKNKFLEIKFEEKIQGGEAITWIKFLKKYSGYFSNEVLRIYDNKSNDRLSFKKKNYQRLTEVHFYFLKEFFYDIFKNCPINIFNILLKILIYKILSLFQK